MSKEKQAVRREKAVIEINKRFNAFQRKENAKKKKEIALIHSKYKKILTAKLDDLILGTCQKHNVKTSIIKEIGKFEISSN